MASYFFDSSALMKQYLIEAGTPAVRKIIRSSATNRIFISQITAVEVVSALARRKREASITPQRMKRARQVFEHHVATEYVSLQLTNSIINLAGDLLDTYPLRASDAVQLATALEVQDRLVAAKIPSL